MKKTVLTLMAALLLCLTSGAWAQRAAYYLFEATNGAEGTTYTPLEGATVLPGLADLPNGRCDSSAWISATEFKKFSAIADDADVTGIPIGFNFPYADQTFTHFVPTTEGYIALIKAGATKADIMPIEKNYAPYGIGLRADQPVYKSAATKVSYKAETEMLSVEFFGFHYDTAKAGEVVTVNEALSVNYTVRLYKDGKVAFYFGEMKGESKGGYDAKISFGIGLNEAGSKKNNLHYRKPSGNWMNPDWTSTTPQIEGSPNGKMGNTGQPIPVGTVWTFTPPAECVAPATPVKAIEVDIIRPLYFHANLDLTDLEADGWISFVSEEALADGVKPETGREYTYNDVVGTAKFMEKNELTRAYTESTGNEEAFDKTQYIYAYLYNDQCTGGPVYSEARMVKILSRPTLEYTYADDKITLFPKGDGDLIVLATSVNGPKDRQNIGNVGDFGIPTADKRVGDTVWTAEGKFGGVVVFKGAQPAAAFNYDKVLEPFTNYHFAAFRSDENGGYRSFFAQADVMTSPEIPYVDDFTANHIPFEAPLGYTVAGEWRVEKNGDARLTASLGANATGDAARLVLELPAIRMPEAADGRFILDYNFTLTKSSQAGSSDNTMLLEDYTGKNGVYVSVKETGGTWREIYKIDAQRPDIFLKNSEYKQHYINIEGFQGKMVTVRVEVIGEHKFNGNMKVRTLSVLERPACDAPLAVTVLPGTVYGDSAKLTWTPFDADQREAVLSYRVAEEDTWYLLAENPADTMALGNLPCRENVVFGVKARCEGGIESAVTESGVTKTGYSLPFVEDFSEMGVYSGYRTMYGIPESWTTSTAALPEEGKQLTLTEGMNTLNVAPIYDWEQHKAVNQPTEGVNNCVQLGSRQLESWLVMPPMFLKENHNAVLYFDAALLKGNAAAAVPATAEDIHDDAKIIVYATVMDEADAQLAQAFTAADAVKTWSKADLAAIGAGKELECTLPAALVGKVRIALYYTIGDRTAAIPLYVDNIAAAAPCGAVVDLRTDSVGEEAVKIRWRAYPKVSEYTVTVRDAEGQAVGEPLKVTEPQATLTGLEIGTPYTVSVTYACTDGNAPAAEISFTTGGMPCDVPTDLAAEVDKTSAVLSWTGGAEDYRLEFKEASAETYILREVKGAKTYTLTNLKTGTDYVFRVKAICNAAAGDESDWSEDKAFKTAEQTCFAPDTKDVTITPSFSLVEISWTGEADEYQLGYRQGSSASTPWTVVAVKGKQYTITGLAAKTAYQVRVRSICAAGDTSAYSAPVDFVTTEMTPCPVPANLRVEDTTLTSAKLAWDKDEQHEGFLLRYRETTATAWDSVKDLKETSYVLASLTAKTAYIWSVNAFCSENRVSGWATANEFSTLEEKQQDTSANEALIRAAFSLYATEGRIHILNRGGLRIDRVEVYTTDGRLMYREVVNTKFHVSIPMTGSRMPVLVVLKTESGSVVYKQMLP